MIEINNIELKNNKITTIEQKQNIKNIDLNTNTIIISLDNESILIDDTVASSINFSDYANIVNIRK
jgi:hypothetical protein